MSNTNIRKIRGYQKTVGNCHMITLPHKLAKKYLLRIGDFVEFKDLGNGTLKVIPLVKVKKHNKRD